jgi:hypothetical protein
MALEIAKLQKTLELAQSVRDWRIPIDLEPDTPTGSSTLAGLVFSLRPR